MSARDIDPALRQRPQFTARLLGTAIWALCLLFALAALVGWP